MVSMTPEQLSHLIDQIYTAALDSESWSQVSVQIQQAIGGHSVNFVIEDTKAKRFKYLFSNGVTDSDVAYYHANVIQRDELTDILDCNPFGQALLTQDIWRLEQLERVWAYDDYYRGIGQTYFDCGKFYESGDTRAFIAVARSHLDPTFELGDRQKLQLLLPHLERALFINKTLLQQKSTIRALGDSFEYLSAAIILLNSFGGVIYANQKAQPFVTRKRCLDSRYSIKLPSGRVNYMLSQQIDRVLASSVYQGGTSLPFIYQGMRHIAYCFPWCGNFNNQEWFGEHARCIIFIVASDSFSVATRYLIELFKLSKAEANVAEGLIRGLSVKDLAANLFVTETTIRFHVKSILKKTKTNSQIAAVSAMLKSLVLPVR